MGFLILYMVLLIPIACLCEYIQTLGKTFIGNYSSFITSGDNFEYNYLMYVVGFVIYAGAVYILYRLMKKRVDITVFSGAEKFGAVAVVLFFGILMFAAMIFVLFLMFGMTSNINPEALLWITVAGWPVGTMIFLFIRLSMDM